MSLQMPPENFHAPSARAEGDEVVQVRDEFISIISHELKTPIASISLQLQILSRSLPAFLGIEPDPGKPPIVLTAETLCQTVQRCERQTRRLADMLDKLMDLTLMRTGRLELHRESVDLVEVVREILEREPSAVSRISVQTASPTIGQWDRPRIEQVVANLISNALKYGMGEPIDVWIETDRELNVARLSVRDRGIGVSPAQHEKIFDRYQRAVPEHLGIGGLGLGLFIARQIVQAHGGLICVQSALDEGATFIVELPLALN